MHLYRLTLSTVLAASSFSAFAQSAPAPASDWNFSAGLGVAAFPRYPGARTTRVLPLPLVTATYKDFFFADILKGVGVQGEVVKGLTLSAAVGANFDSRESKDNAKLSGLRDISVAPAVILGADYTLGRTFMSVNLSERLGSGTRRGGVASAELGYNVWTGANLKVGAGVTAHAMDKTYARNFFGIDAAQSVASGLPVYEAKAGLRDAGLFVQGQYQIDDHWSLSSRIALVKLSSSAGRSPIVERRVQPAFLFAANRSF